MGTKQKQTAVKLLLYLVSLILFFFFVPRLLRFFMPFLLGWMIALIANPLVRFFEKRLKIVRKHGSLVVIVGVLALVIVGCYCLMSWCVNEVIDLAKSLPYTYTTAQQEFRDLAASLSGLLGFLPEQLRSALTGILVNLDAYVGQLIGTIGGPTLEIASDLAGKMPNLMVLSIFMLLSAYFFVADKEQITDGLRQVLPTSIQNGWQWVKDVFAKAVGGYFIAQFKIMGIIAVILAAGFAVLGIKHSVLLAIAISFLDFLPFLGTGTAIWPWAVYLVVCGRYYTAAGLMVVYVICLLVHQILQPKFVGDTVGMNSLTTLIFMFIGYRLQGMIGMILAVPVGMTIVSLYRVGAFNQIIGDVQDLVQALTVYGKGRDE